jgi:hypothetical protein
MADLSRRDFTRLLALSGSLSFFPSTLFAERSGQKSPQLNSHRQSAGIEIGLAPPA